MGIKRQRAICSFGGGGGGASGVKRAHASLFGEEAAFDLCGSFDSDPYACKVYEYLTGSEQICCNVREMNCAMMREFYGEESPFLIVGSAPCLPAHGLVLTPTGARRIDSLRLGDMALTHMGRYRAVKHLGCEHYTGIMYGLRVQGINEVQEFTAEHPIYVRRGGAPPIYVKASELRMGDLLGFPMGEEECAPRMFVDGYDLATFADGEIFEPLVEDGIMWTPLVDIRHRVTAETVWNIEVEEDHSFCTPMMIVSNCQGSSKLLSTAKSKTSFYVSLNELALVNLRLIIEAWAPDLMRDGELLEVDAETRQRALAGLPGLILFENVPNITSRAKPMLAEVRRLLRAVGFVLQDGYHECRHVGNLAQRRKRWFLIARNPARVPAFLYLPPKRPGLVCGDVLNPLPMPGDPVGGPMHVLPAISALNWWRLWAIPAGGDWRDLLPNDGTPRRARFRRHHVERMTDPSITVAGSGSNGPCAVADERVEPSQGRFHHVDRVTPWNGETGTVTHSPAPSSGAIAVADPIATRFKGTMGVLDPAEASGAVTCEAYPSTGPFSYADGRLDLGISKSNPDAHRNKYAVVGEGGTVGTVTGATCIGGGAPSYADPRALDLARAAPGFTSMDHVLGWGDPSRTITGAMRPGQGAPSCADPRPLAIGHKIPGESEAWFHGALGVLHPDEPSGAVFGGASPNSGRFSYADPKALDLALFRTNPGAFHHKYGVACADKPAGTVTTASNLGEGMPSYADPKAARYGFEGTLGVLGQDQPAAPVTCRAGSTTGPFSYAAPPPTPLDLQPQRGNEGMHHGKYVVVAMDSATGTVTGATRIGSGAPSVAQPLAMKEGNFHHGQGMGKMGVLPLDEVASAVIGNARIATGPFSVAAAVPGDLPTQLDLVPRETCYDRGYAVIDRAREPSNTIAGNSFVGCGTYAITDDVPAPLDLELGCSPHAGAYGVISTGEPSPAVVAAANIDNSRVAIAARPAHPPYVVLSYAEAKRVADGHVVAPFAIVDPDHPDVPLAIVEDMAKPPFRWEERQAKGKNGKPGKITRVKVTVPLVLISADGTWHRPLTTLELAVLQGLEWMHNGKALDFGGGATEQRRTIGNMIPAPVGEAFANQFLAAGIASAAGALFMYGSGGGLWVHPDRFEELRRAGVQRVRQQDLAKIAEGETVLLDDAAPPLRRKRTKIPGPPKPDAAPVKSTPAPAPQRRIVPSHLH